MIGFNTWKSIFYESLVKIFFNNDKNLIKEKAQMFLFLFTETHYNNQSITLILISGIMVSHMNTR